jgi:spermidine dehydrogenase
MSTRKNNTSGMLAAAADGITRRDFLDGIAIAIGGAASGALLPRFIAAAVAEEAAAQDAAGYYPPTLTGLRGSHPGSFETAHALRDADFWQHAIAATGEDYDLVVVGGGISGLAAAYFYRARRPDARILIIDNHDDVGGHAKRNEFGLAGRLALMNGGTYAIDTPRPYSAIADGLLRTLGVDPVALTKKCADENFYAAHGLARGIFFDRETFGADKLVVARKGAAWRDILAAAPLPDKARDDIVRIEEGKTDYFPGLSPAEKKARLARMSYRDFLRDVVKADPAAIAVYQARSHGEWGVGADAVSALDVRAFDFPGFQGLKLEPGPAPHMGYTASGYADGGSYTFHFPDGNASLARLLVRNLIPESLPGTSAEDVVTAKLDYARLDRAQAPVRIRLNATAVRVDGDCLRARWNAFISARTSLRARLLQHDHSVSLPGIAAAAERGAVLCVEDSADLYQCGLAKGFRRRACLCAGLVFFFSRAQRGGGYRRLCERSFAGRARAGPSRAGAGRARLAGARAAPHRPARHSLDQLRDL